MRILSKTLSERTEQIVCDVTKSVSRPIQYFDIELRPNSTYGAFGSVDTHPGDGIYKIWISQSLSSAEFETNLLHELRHIVQVESGYSEVYNKDTPEFHSRDRDFVQEVGAHLSSLVLDIEVNNWLTHNGYSQEGFFLTNLNGLIQASDYQYKHWDDPLNFANLSCSLLLACVNVEDEHADKLLQAYSSYPQIVNIVSDLRCKLREMSITSPQSSAIAHSLLIDSLNLWRYYYVALPGSRIRTKNEYLAFLAARS